MWFLIFQILLLLLLAALFGAALVYWWMNNRFEDVSESYAELQERADAFADRPDLVTREDLDTGLTQLLDRINALPQPDLSTVSMGLTGLERRIADFSAPEPDLTGLELRLEQLETVLAASGPDMQIQREQLNVIASRLAGVSDAVAGLRNTDIEPVETRLARLEEMVRSVHIPEVDLGPVHTGLAALDLKVGEARTPSSEFDSIRAQLTALGSRFDRITTYIETPPAQAEPDMSGIESELAALGVRLDQINAQANARQPSADVEAGALRTQVAALETRLEKFAERLGGARETDMEVITSRLATLSSSFAALRMPDMTSLQERLFAIERGLASLSFPETDLRPLQARFDRLESFLGSLAQQPAISAPDVEAMQGKLASLERVLAELSSRVSSLHNTDLAPFSARLAGMEAALDALDIPEVDLSSLQARFSTLDASFHAIQDELQNLTTLKSIERRLTTLQENVLDAGQPDLTPVLKMMHTIDNRLDLGAVENRLTAVEYGLAALHRMLNSRADTSFTTVETEVRARPRSESAIGRTETSWQRGSNPELSRKRESRTVVQTEGVSRRGEDPISAYIRADSEANLLTEAVFGHADTLEDIKGVGPMLAALLNDVGVFYFWQIAEWTDEDVEFVDSRLMHFGGRIQRDDWIGQARKLARLPMSAKRPVSRDDS